MIHAAVLCSRLFWKGVEAMLYIVSPSDSLKTGEPVA